MNPLNDWIAFDVETIGDEDGYALLPWRATYHQAGIRTYALSWIKDGKLKNRAVAAERDPQFRYNLSEMLKAQAASGKYLVTWKGTFDIAWLISLGLREEAYACKWIDALVLWKQLDRTRMSYSMDNAIAEFLPGKVSHKGTVDFEGDLDELLKYNADDTNDTLVIALKIWSQLTERERNAVMIDFCDMPAIAERNVEGIFIDIDGVKETAAFLYKQRSENYEKLQQHLENIGNFRARGGKLKPADMKKRFTGWDKLDPERFNKIADKIAINLDSDDDVRNLLFEQWGLPIQKMTKGGKSGLNKKAACDKEALMELSHLDERASWIQKYRETTGLISKCVKAVVTSIKYNDVGEGTCIVRPEMNKAGTVTDRCTYSSYMDVKK